MHAQRISATLQGIGEPPLPLAASVFFAIKNAIKAARAQNGVTDYFQLNSPATCERIRMACSDCFTEQVFISKINYVGLVVL